ncbi:IgGFc-binding protein-like [Gigantopelta aegis]|uniref:IgGFc-binding protein-like n=1 Tax=Gigantopelta aegis TaxID=1735272 RepID=UPI001B8889EC|nr:IgGFc-binding protein-like [Gigantopelta aegis]
MTFSPSAHIVVIFMLKTSQGLVYPEETTFDYIGMIPENYISNYEAAYLLLTSTHPANVSIYVPFLRSGAIEEFVLSSNETRKLQLDVTLRMPSESLVSRRAFLVKSTGAISVVLLDKQLLNLDALQFMELESLGKRYTAFSFLDGLPGSFVAIAIPFEVTEIRVRLPSGVKPITVSVNGQKVVIDPEINLTLNAYDAFQITSPDDLTGTTVKSDKRVAMFAGHLRTNNRGGCLDHCLAQMYTTSDLGSKYIAFGYRKTGNEDTIRITSVYDKTSVMVNNETALYLANSSLFEDVYLPGNAFYYIDADKPVQAGCIGVSSNPDPSMWLYTPLPFRCSSYVFTVPSVPGYTSAMKNDLVLIVDSAATEDIFLNGERVSPNWMNVTGSSYSGSYIPVSGVDTTFHVTHGQHVPFAVYVLSSLPCVSYAFRLVTCDNGTREVTFPEIEQDVLSERVYFPINNVVVLKRHLNSRFDAYYGRKHSTSDSQECLVICLKYADCFGVNFAPVSLSGSHNCEILLTNEGVSLPSEDWDAHTIEGN